jgi:nucleotide-binding universal stress UspA family protein
MYRTILVPTDGSRGARAAVDKAVELASLFNADLHVLYVLDTEQFSPDKPAEAVDDLLEEEAERAESTLSDLETAAEDAGVDPVFTTVRRGSPAAEILACADDVGAELVVMGTHGEGGMETTRLGSIADAVADRIDRPLLLI